MKRFVLRNLAAMLVFFVGLTSSASASITISFAFSGGLQGNDANAQANRQSFLDAGDFWEGIITGYVDGSSRTLTIQASTFEEGPDEDGTIVLGSAGPGQLARLATTETSFFVPITGGASFNVDSRAIPSGRIDPLTIEHEIGHILGIGTLWDDDGQLFSFNDIDYEAGSGQYFGENALAAYRNEFDPNAEFIPIELQGGPGTADGHWDEVVGGGLVVLSGPNQGEQFNDELLTGTLSGSGFLSDTSLGSLRDLGYTTIDFRAVAIPEPSSLALLGIVFVSTAARRRKK
jgi:hypothetical protein